MRYIPNPKLPAELQLQPEFQHGLTEVGGEIAETAKSMTPVGPDPRRGHLRDSFVVEPIKGGVAVGSQDSFFHLAEYGSAKNPAYAPLRRAVRASGLRFEEE